jgi:5,10-methylenetetrahydrofolate reductase
MFENNDFKDTLISLNSLVSEVIYRDMIRERELFIDVDIVTGILKIKLKSQCSIYFL